MATRRRSTRSVLVRSRLCVVLNQLFSIVFLRLCQSFDLTPTFAKVDKARRSKWKQSSEPFTRNVISEELNGKIKQSAYLKREINSMYDEIRQSCSLLRYTCVLHTMVSLRKEVPSGSYEHSHKEDRTVAQDRNGR